MVNAPGQVVDATGLLGCPGPKKPKKRPNRIYGLQAQKTLFFY